MFSTLESSWDKSAHRGWSAVASFGFQLMALSLLLLIPLFTVQGPPRLLLWDVVLAPPPAPPPAPSFVQEHQHRLGNMNGVHLVPPTTIPLTIAQVPEAQAPAAPDLHELGVAGETGSRRGGVTNSIGDPATVATPPPPPPPAPTHPLKISHWAEGNVIYRVQPVYPPLARQARIQGTVQLRAIISKTGAIERLMLESGHPMLAGAAIDAVRKWRYRPYLLNDQPVEIETEITVNFVLSGS
jgi:protein TonB